jgi:hypothetical protein
MAGLKMRDAIEAHEKAGSTPKPKPGPVLEVHHGGSAVANARIGKKATVGHFSEDMSRKLNSMAKLDGKTLQAIMGEAWDLWLVSKGEKPFGER